MRSASAKRQGLKEEDIDEAIANYDGSARFTATEKLALRYSEWMALNPDRIDAAFHTALRRHYSDEKIVELGLFIGFNVGYHTFFGTLRFYPMFAPDGRLVSQAESARIYGEVPVSLQAPASGIHLDARHPDGATAHPSRHPGASRDPGHATSERASIFAGAPNIEAGVTHMVPLSPEDIRDPELKALIARCTDLGVPDERFTGVLAHTPVHAKAVLRALLLSHTEGNIDHRLKELIRVKLARTAGDPYFARLRSRRAMQEGLDEAAIEAGCGRFETDQRFTGAEKWALRYAHELYRNPERIDAAFYGEGKRHYSEAQIMELGAFIALHYGMQAYARALSISPS